LTLEVLEDRSVPAFLAPVTSAAGGHDLTVADVNKDGRDDVVAIHDPAHVAVNLSNGDGSFRPGATLTTTKGILQSVNVADVNGDGRLDVVGHSFKFKGTEPRPRYSPLYGTVVEGTYYENVWLGKKNGTFSAVKSTVVAEFYANWPVTINNSTSASVDFNQDGITDKAFLLAGDSQVTVQLGTGEVTPVVQTPFGPRGGLPVYGPPQVFDAGPEPIGLAVGDFNGDGQPDIVVANSSAGVPTTLTVLLNDGNW
jgi:hypothetical protein